VKLSAHLALEGRINQLVLTHARQARKGRRYDAGLIVVAISGKVLDLDLGLGKGIAQISL
jgi:hypothetical protein